jgi:dTDP-4-amino-4,6-dideoxygalactose transaminase
LKIPLVDLKAQYRNLKPDIDAALAAVIDETAFISGKYARDFETAFAAFLEVEHCVGCANGTDAIEIILKVLGIGPGDEVIVPALTWISTSEAVSSIGANPVFVDILEDTFTMDPARLRTAINPSTRAIIPVHLYGLPAELDEILAIAAEHDLIVVEDAAQAHGARYRGRKVGTFAPAATFSFYPGKNLGAYGDAGCIVSDDAGLAERARLFANHGQPKKNEHKFEGRNSRLDGLQAAVLSVKLQHLEGGNEARRRHAESYRHRLAGLPIKFQHCPGHSDHVYHVFAIRTPRRDELRTHLSEAGVSTGIHYPTALPFLDVYQGRAVDADSFPVSAKIPSELLSLPMYPELTEEQIDYICRVVIDFFESK